MISHRDTEVAALCRQLRAHLSRAGTVGVLPAFVSMIREMILECAHRERRCFGMESAGGDARGPA